MRTIVGLSVLSMLALSAGVVCAQFPSSGYPSGPYGGYGGYAGPFGGVGAVAPGIFSRGPSRQLTPYLNLANGGDPATNYYNFVRPGLYGQNRMNAGAMGGVGLGRPSSLFPTLQQIDDDDLPGQKKLPKKNEMDEKEPIRVALPPTGHAAGFTNSMGFFGPLMAAQGGIGSAGHGAAAGQRRR